MIGCDPLRSADRINPADRYTAMDEHFVANGCATAGAVMMASTASLQVKLDAGPPSPGRPDAGRLVRAYDDAAGVTAAFNRNVLAVLNRELGATFDETAFEHVALWDAEQEWIEMRLRSRGEQVVRVAALDLDVAFAAGEEMRTGVSAKFRR